MPSFFKNKQTDNFDVIGLADEVGIGDVAVTKKDGTKKTVHIYHVSSPFVGKYGQDKGKQCVIGKVGKSQGGLRDSGGNPSYRIRTPNGTLINQDDACEMCGHDKWECGHQIGW